MRCRCGAEHTLPRTGSLFLASCGTRAFASLPFYLLKPPWRPFLLRVLRLAPQQPFLAGGRPYTFFYLPTCLLAVAFPFLRGCMRGRTCNATNGRHPPYAAGMPVWFPTGILPRLQARIYRWAYRAAFSAVHPSGRWLNTFFALLNAALSRHRGGGRWRARWRISIAGFLFRFIAAFFGAGTLGGCACAGDAQLRDACS